MQSGKLTIVERDNGLEIHGELEFLLELESEFDYIGHQEIIIKDVAKADQFIYVVHDEKDIEKMFLVQSEYYLPDNNHSYNYRSKDIITLEDINWIRDNFIYKVEDLTSNKQSDSSQTALFLREHGFERINYGMNNRLVNLYDEANRYEILLIYSENVEKTVETPTKLIQDGGIDDQLWSEEKIKLQQRALGAFSIHTT